MPVLNGEKNHIRETLNSVLNQSYANLEFIIIDDGSTDSTFSIIAEHAKLDKRIRLIHNRKNLGIVESLNEGIKQASSGIIARIDCGDIAGRKRIEKQYGFLADHRDFILVSSQANWVTRNGERLFTTMYPSEDAEIRKRLFLKDSILIHPAVMYRKIEGLFYRDIAATAEDYDYWLRLSMHGKLFIIDEPLMTVRLDPDGTTYSKKMRQVRTVDLIHKSFLKNLGNPDAEITWQIAALNNLDILQQKLFHRFSRYAIKYSRASKFLYYFFKLLSGISSPSYMYKLAEMRLRRLTVSKDPMFQRYLSLSRE